MRRRKRRIMMTTPPTVLLAISIVMSMSSFAMISIHMVCLILVTGGFFLNTGWVFL